MRQGEGNSPRPNKTAFLRFPAGPAEACIRGIVVGAGGARHPLTMAHARPDAYLSSTLETPFGAVTPHVHLSADAEIRLLNSNSGD